MADETEVEINDGGQQVQNDATIEAEARRGGWQPKDRWHGDPAVWVDAAKFVERGKELAPHLARAAGELRRENERLSQTTAAQATQLEEMRGQVASLAVFRNEVTQRERERIRSELVAELAASRQSGDIVTEASIIAKLGTPPPAAEPVKPAVVTPPAATTQQLPVEMTNWIGANDWYKRDTVLQQAMNIVGAELRRGGQLEGMNLTQQLDATAKIVLQRYAPPPAGNSRVEGGRSSGEGGGSGRAASTDGYESLPAHIKAECDAQGERMGLIGPKQLYKTKEEWRKHYAVQYNRSPPGTGYDYRPPGN